MSTKNQLQIDLKNEKELKTLGFIVNPVAGMGGAVGLKGTDGKDILRKAIKLGATPVAPKRANSFLFELGKLVQNVKLIVGGGDMGEKEALKSGFEYSICSKSKKSTDAKDTIEIATKMLDLDLKLLVFCGGDGTARDIEKAVNLSVPVIGVPTGVKMHSAIFALNPQAAARVTAKFLKSELPVKETEVMDVDEKAFREGHLSAHLYGYMLAPYEPLLLQGNKIASPITENELRNQAAISVYIIENMEPDVIYILGPGTTTRAIADLLDEKKTLLGVDLFCDKKIIAKDVTEKKILNKIKGKHAKILVTPIGGQGFVFGRGNQQISSDVIKKVGLNNIIILATKSKLSGLKQLRIDTGDKELDDLFRENKLKVITDYRIELLVKAE
jgi:predicted polyphosphate/ATP-dependent NAD kinase